MPSAPTNKGIKSQSNENIVGTKDKMMAEIVVVAITTASTVEGVPDATSMGEITHLATHRTLGILTVPPTPTPTTGEPIHDPATSSHRAEILGGVIGGASCLVIIMLAMILWWRRGCRCVRCRLKGRKSREQVVAPEGHYAAEIGTDPRNRSTFYSRDPIDRHCLPLPLFDQGRSRNRTSSQATTYSEFLRRAEATERQRAVRPRPGYEMFVLPHTPSPVNFSRPVYRGAWKESYNQVVNLSYNDNYKLEQIRSEQTTPTTLTTVTADRLLGQPHPPSYPDANNTALDDDISQSNGLSPKLRSYHSTEVLLPDLPLRYFEAEKKETSSPSGLQRIPTFLHRLGVTQEAFRTKSHTGDEQANTQHNDTGLSLESVDGPSDDISIVEHRDWDLPTTAPTGKRYGIIFFPDRSSIELQESPFDDTTSQVEFHDWAIRNYGGSSEKSPVGVWSKSSSLTGTKPGGSNAPLVIAPTPTTDLPHSANAIRSTHEDQQDIVRFDMTKVRPVTL